MTFSSIKEKFIYFNLPVILFSLIPFFLITGPFLSDLSISLIGLIYLIYFFKKKDFSNFKNYYFYFFFIFWIYFLFNSLVNNINLDSLKISFFYIRYAIFVISITALLRININNIFYFYYILCICFIVLICDGFFQYFIGENIFGFTSNSKFRITSFFGKEEILGSYLSRLWPIFFGLSLLLYNNKNKLFIFIIIIFILSEALVFLSGDRTAFFYINLSAIFIIIFSKKIAKLRLVTLFFSFLLIFIISIINPTAKERVFDHTLKQMGLIKEENNKENKIYIFSKQHTSHYKTAYKIFLDNKALGVGVKNFRNFCSNVDYFIDKNSCATHPHNYYVQLLVETGIIGLFFLVFLFFYFCKILLKHFKYRLNGNFYFTDFEITILSGILIYLWPLVPTGSFFNNWLNIIMILNIPMLILSRKLINFKKQN